MKIEVEKLKVPLTRAVYFLNQRVDEMQQYAEVACALSTSCNAVRGQVEAMAVELNAKKCLIDLARSEIEKAQSQLEELRAREKSAKKAEQKIIQGQVGELLQKIARLETNLEAQLRERHTLYTDLCLRKTRLATHGEEPLIQTVAHLERLVDDYNIQAGVIEAQSGVKLLRITIEDYITQQDGVYVLTTGAQKPEKVELSKVTVQEDESQG